MSVSTIVISNSNSRFAFLILTDIYRKSEKRRAILEQPDMYNHELDALGFRFVYGRDFVSRRVKSRNYLSRKCNKLGR